jgi:hypothetical protein
MKKFIFVSLASLLAMSVNAQLSNTKWTGTIHSDNPIDVVFDFRIDTIEVTSLNDGSSLETLSYSVKDSVITLKKLFGQSACDTGEGKYTFAVKNDALYFTLVSDPCNDRSAVLNNSKWDKQKPR